MKVIISIAISVIGSHYIKADFFSLLALITLALDLYEGLLKLMIKLRCR